MVKDEDNEYCSRKSIINRNKGKAVTEQEFDRTSRLLAVKSSRELSKGKIMKAKFSNKGNGKGSSNKGGQGEVIYNDPSIPPLNKDKDSSNLVHMEVDLAYPVVNHVSEDLITNTISRQVLEHT